MFKVNKIEYFNKTFRMPEPLLKNLELVAQRQDISLNRLVIQCCEYALKNLESGSPPSGEVSAEHPSIRVGQDRCGTSHPRK